MTEPCDLSAVESRPRILARSLSPVELLQSSVARIERTNRVCNAIVATGLRPAAARELGVPTGHSAFHRRVALPLKHAV
jgi:Asp-tRNA(Asn)/Glu-tRNA(Gln) amidotransferase A subunit family amidase